MILCHSLCTYLVFPLVVGEPGISICQLHLHLLFLPYVELNQLLQLVVLPLPLSQLRLLPLQCLLLLLEFHFQDLHFLALLLELLDKVLLRL